MKLEIRGNPTNNTTKIAIVDDEKDNARTELHCVTHFTLGTEGADITVWIPEIDLEISIGKDTGDALLAIEKLRVQLRELEAYVDDAKRAAGNGRVSGEPLAQFITRILEER